MKILIISDLHANFDALSALPESYDELWVLGDIVQGDCSARPDKRDV